eukprot:1156395-Pelagomonas_calceolata.AAC.4
MDITMHSLHVQVMNISVDESLWCISVGCCCLRGPLCAADVEEIFADYEPRNFNPDLSQWRGGGQIQQAAALRVLFGVHLSSSVPACPSCFHLPSCAPALPPPSLLCASVCVTAEVRGVLMHAVPGLTVHAYKLLCSGHLMFPEHVLVRRLPTKT